MPQNNVTPCDPIMAIRFIKAIVDMPAKIRPTLMLSGPPGIGKSSLVMQASQQMYHLDPKIVRLPGKESADMQGIPKPDPDGKTFGYIEPRFIPQEGAGFLFFDDLSSASRDILAIFYSIALDRILGERKIPDPYTIIAAGNGTLDGAIVNDMGTALNDKMMHLVVTPSLASFIRHHEAGRLLTEIIALVSHAPWLLNQNQQRVEEDLLVGPTPRAWERASNVMQQILPKGITSQGDIGVAKIAISGNVGTACSDHLIDILCETARLPPAAELVTLASADMQNYLAQDSTAAISQTFDLLRNIKTPQQLLQTGAAMTQFASLDMNCCLQPAADSEQPAYHRFNGADVARIALNGIRRLAKRFNHDLDRDPSPEARAIKMTSEQL